MTLNLIYLELNFDVRSDKNSKKKKKYPAYWLGEALKDIIIEIWPKALIVGLNPKAKKKKKMFLSRQNFFLHMCRYVVPHDSPKEFPK